MPVLSFNPIPHIYAVDGRPQPSVTGIMRACGLSGTYEFRDRIHAFRGSIVHDASSIIIAGGDPVLGPLKPPYDSYPDYVKVHAEIPGYLDAIRKAHSMIGFSGAIYECGMIDVLAGYGGRFDFLAWSSRKKNQIWDIKSGTYPVMTIVQMCAYEDLMRRGLPIDEDHPGLDWMKERVTSGEPFERCGLRLEKTGKFTAYYECPRGRSYQDPMWMAAWRSCLFLYKNVPEHLYMEADDLGRDHQKSRLSDLKWVSEAIKELRDPLYSTAKRAGENIWHLRETYNLL
jgi:hypothetical protein